MQCEVRISVNYQDNIDNIDGELEARKDDGGGDDPLVGVAAHPVQVEDDGELDEGGNIEHRNGEVESCLEGLAEHHNTSKVPNTEQTSNGQAEPDVSERQVANQDKETVNIRSHLEYFSHKLFIEIEFMGPYRSCAAFLVM